MNTNMLRGFLYIMLRDYLSFGSVEKVLHDMEVHKVHEGADLEPPELSRYVDTLVNRLIPVEVKVEDAKVTFILRTEDARSKNPEWKMSAYVNGTLMGEFRGTYIDLYGRLMTCGARLFYNSEADLSNPSGMHGNVIEEKWMV